MAVRVKRALAGLLAAAALACAACSSTTPAPRPTPNRFGLGQATLLIVQCFLDHQLIPAAALHPAVGLAGDDSSLWVKNGKVLDNRHLGDWYRSVGSAVPVKGKAIGDWITGLQTSRKNWPSKICGPMPAVK